MQLRIFLIDDAVKKGKKLLVKKQAIKKESVNNIPKKKTILVLSVQNFSWGLLPLW